MKTALIVFAVPVVVFIWAFLASLVMDFTMENQNSWWSFPAYMALEFFLLAVGVTAILACIVGIIAVNSDPVPPIF